MISDGFSQWGGSFFCLLRVSVLWRRCVYSACRYARDPSLCKVRVVSLRPGEHFISLYSMYKMTAAFPRTVATLALLARLTAGAKVCGRVPDCVIDVGRACAKKHFGSLRRGVRSGYPGRDA